jgi:hypothetical protein
MKYGGPVWRAGNMSLITEKTRDVGNGVLPAPNIQEIYALNFSGQNGDGASSD